MPLESELEVRGVVVELLNELEDSAEILGELRKDLWILRRFLEEPDGFAGFLLVANKVSIVLYHFQFVGDRREPELRLGKDKRVDLRWVPVCDTQQFCLFLLPILRKYSHFNIE